MHISPLIFAARILDAFSLRMTILNIGERLAVHMCTIILKAKLMVVQGESSIAASIKRIQLQDLRCKKLLKL